MEFRYTRSRTRYSPGTKHFSPELKGRLSFRNTKKLYSDNEIYFFISNRRLSIFRLRRILTTYNSTVYQNAHMRMTKNGLPHLRGTCSSESTWTMLLYVVSYNIQRPRWVTQNLSTVNAPAFREKREAIIKATGKSTENLKSSWKSVHEKIHNSYEKVDEENSSCRQLVGIILRILLIEQLRRRFLLTCRWVCHDGGLAYTQANSLSNTNFAHIYIKLNANFFVSFIRMSQMYERVTQ